MLLAELVALGVSDPTPVYRGVRYTADLVLGYRAHLVLRTASRIQRILGELPAGSPKELAAALATVAWPEWLLARNAYTIDPILTDPAAQSLGVEKLVADAIARAQWVPPPGGRGAEQGQVEASEPEDRSPSPRTGSPPPLSPPGGGTPGPRLSSDALVTVVAHVRNGVCTLGLDTAGRALHKRGWRLPGHPAVIKETLAAAILMLAGYDGSEALIDGMCGSGTLAIEGAYIALGKAPLIHRGKDDFGFEHHAGFDRALWRRVSDEVRAARRPEPPAPIYARDLREEFVDLARKGALRARVEKHIQFTTGSFIDLVPPAERGLLVANLPYGERIGRGEIEALYKEVGRVVRDRFAAWKVALLVPAEAPRSALRVPVRREYALFNGSIPVRLLLVGRGYDGV